MYVGKAKNLNKRVSSYFLASRRSGQNTQNLLEKTRILVSQITKIKHVVTDSEIQALLLEANYIKLYKPKYNAKLTDDKAYPLIRITIKNEYPSVLVVRRNEDRNSLYFGPFPNASAIRLVLRTIRRIFPFQSVSSHPNKVCLYNHLGLCSCPGVLKDKDYKKNIRHIITFLKGNTKKVISNLEKERAVLSKLEEFEKAQDVQKKIDAIKYITSPSFDKFDYKINPNLEEDIRYRELLELKNTLLKHNISVKNLDRIECYDISNTSGTNATGSMVVFINGGKDSSQYRKFKIRTLDTPNDFAMIKEVLRRRLNHFEWRYPDLIIVDGGRGQVSSAIDALIAMKQSSNEAIDIPIIGLAKREETIITSDFKEIKLPKDSEALKLIMRIRDEAHRFALTYHRQLRSKHLIS